MDYKKILKSRKLRMQILNLLRFIPDKQMLNIQYRIKMGRKLNLKKPTRYTEKLQWYKLYHKDVLMAQCVDKYDVRSYVDSKGLGHILNTCYGLFDTPDEIDFNILPNAFVLKDTLGSGGNDVIICTDKTKLDIENTKKIMWGWVNKTTGKTGGREWMYEGRRHRIIVEKCLLCDDRDLPDYKLFCFNGKVEIFYIKKNYIKTHVGEVQFFNEKKMPINLEMDYCNGAIEQIAVPENMDDMFAYAEILSRDFPHARIDFYNINGHIVFGEITFFNASGYMKFNPDTFDEEIGAKFKLPERG